MPSGRSTKLLIMKDRTHSLKTCGEEREKLDIVSTFGFPHLLKVIPRTAHTRKSHINRSIWKYCNIVNVLLWYGLWMGSYIPQTQLLIISFVNSFVKVSYTKWEKKKRKRNNVNHRFATCVRLPTQPMKEKEEHCWALQLTVRWRTSRQ